MNFKRIESYRGNASKLSTGVPLPYCLWEDENRVLYYQVVGNRSRGTFSKYLFPVLEYKYRRNESAPLGQINGYDLEKEEFCSVDNNNNGAFLKAVLRDLYDEDHDGIELIVDGKFNHDAFPREKKPLPRKLPLLAFAGLI
jgi:hypothetical protein